ncbi:MAG: PKD domain-containing protein, partial [Saprospiraceae bacterium]|nr:PKD domain-containing protein [Saprospiraceae bacterium]
MSKYLYLILIVLFSHIAWSQGCPGMVDAEAFPPKVCSPSGTVNLIGNILSGNLQSVEWSPSIGLSDPNSLSTTANVAFPITYTLTGKFLTNNNVINNGNFDGGNNGFFSNYVNDQTSLWLEGRYAVGSNPQSFHPNFAPCGDHTTGTGSMMIVNGAGIAGQNVYCQVVNVNPTSDYVFSIWVASVISTSPAVLQFSVNGQLLGGTLNASGATCVWTNFTAVWENPGVSSALICIVNQNTALSGNDFAIDDVEFLEICSDTAQVHVDIVNVDALALPPPILSCDVPVVDLDGSLSTSGPNVTYEWTTANGNIVSGATSNIAQANRPGTYQLTVTYDDGDIRCEKQANVTVIGDSSIPVADAPTEYWISCNADSVIINASNSTSGQGYTTFWTTTNGNIRSGINTLTPVVDAPGDYVLTILNNISGCKDTLTVTVNEDQAVPIAVSTPADTLTCRNSNLTLSGIGSSVGNNYSYQWTTGNGNIVSGGTSLNPVINAAGTYRLIVHNTQNNCRDTSLSQVAVNRVFPVAELDTTDVLNCQITELELQTIYPPNHPIFQVEWWDTTSILLSGPDSSSLSVSAPGMYYVSYTDPANGCTTLDSLEILQDIDPPAADAGPGNILSCNLDSLILNGSGTGAHSNLSYQWTTVNGNILSGGQTPTPFIDQDGLYYLTVTDLENGCTALDSVQIDRDADQPVVDISSPPAIDCNNPIITIDASNSDQGANFLISWYSQQGNIVSGQQSLQPVVDAPGLYQLTIRDTSNGCETREIVSVSIDTISPQVNLALPTILDCQTTNSTLEAILLSNIANYTSTWSSPNGNIVNGNNTFTPLIDQPGNYIFEIQNTDNGCTSTEEVEVLQDINQPTVVLAAPDTLNCSNDKVTIQTNGSSAGNRFVYQWTDPGNNNLAPVDPLAPLVDQPGNYTLIIEDTINHCTNALGVIISMDVEEPMVTLATPGLLTCANEESTLSLSIGNSSGNFEYTWTSQSGNIVSGSTTSSPVVNEPGIYYVEVTNLNNGCSTTDSLSASQDIQEPTVNINPADTLNCTAPTISLSGTVADAGNNYDINWTTGDGNIQSGQQSLNPEVSEAGTYNLTVINNDNGCQSTALITVVQDEDLPVASVAQPALLTCAISQITLDGTASSQGPEFNYSWSTSQGNIISGG